MSPYCDSCFCQVIERRVKKQFKDAGARPHEKILIIDDGSLVTKVGMLLLERIKKNLPLTILTSEPSAKLPDHDWIIDMRSGSKKAAEFLMKMIAGDRSSDTQKHSIELLSCLSDEEILTFAKIKKIKGQIPSPDEFDQLLIKVENQYPGSTFGLIRSSEQFEK